MRSIYTERLITLKSAVLASASRGDSCKVSEDDLLGNWAIHRGSAFYEEMAIGPDGEFDSWLHNHPEVAGGLWAYKNCILVIKHSPGDATRSNTS